jgi:Domain of unknown function (DUF4371)
LIDCTVWLGRQDVAFRGHNDDQFPRLVTSAGSLSDLMSEPHGNFNALIIMRVHAGDTKLRDHLELSPGKEIYASHDSQNEYINITGGQIQQQILLEARESPFFSVLADSSIDLSARDNLALALRYISPVGTIQESLVEVVNVSGSTTGSESVLRCYVITVSRCFYVVGHSLAGAILDRISAYGLNPKKLRGQGYDGAANMAGRFQGVQARVSHLYSGAVYVHCYAHKLNLALVEACNVLAVQRFMELLRSLAKFFGTPKRGEVLSRYAKSIKGNKKKKFPVPDSTRWTDNAEAAITFIQLFPALVDALQDIEKSSDFNSDDTQVAAERLQNDMLNFETALTGIVSTRNGALVMRCVSNSL